MAVHLDQVVLGEPIDYAARSPALRAAHVRLTGHVLAVDYGTNPQVLVARPPRLGARTGRGWMALTTLFPTEFTFADLKSWRTKEGLSQQGLAERLGVDVITVSRWERGETHVPPYLRPALKTVGAMRAECAERVSQASVLALDS